MRFVAHLAPGVLGLAIVSAQVARADQAEQQKQQAEQYARQIEAQHRPFVQAQLELARSTCGSLPAGVRRQVAAAADGPLRAWADECFPRHLGGQRNVTKPMADPLATIHEAVAAALEPHVPADELAAFRREHAAAIARRARAARMQIVAKLDQRLMLSGSQRTAIGADLEKHWQPDWLIELTDAGAATIGGFPPAADFADRCISPHLAEPQRAAWKEWSQKAGWIQIGQRRPDAYTVLNMNSMRQPFPLDPWWNP